MAVKWGLVLAGALFIKRIADTTQVFAHDEAASTSQGHEVVKNLPAGVMVYRVFGALLFGAADKLDSPPPRVLRCACRDPPHGSGGDGTRRHRA